MMGGCMAFLFPAFYPEQTDHDSLVEHALLPAMTLTGFQAKASSCSLAFCFHLADERKTCYNRESTIIGRTHNMVETFRESSSEKRRFFVENHGHECHRHFYRSRHRPARSLDAALVQPLLRTGDPGGTLARTA